MNHYVNHCEFSGVCGYIILVDSLFTFTRGECLKQNLFVFCSLSMSFLYVVQFLHPPPLPVRHSTNKSCSGPPFA